MKFNINGFGAVGIIVIIVAVSAIGFAGYTVLSSDDETSGSVVEQQTNSAAESKDVATEPAAEQAATKGAVITSGDSEFGTMLFDDKNQAIYIWEVEDSTTPECYDVCAEAWPPVLTDGAPTASGEVKSELLGTTKRSDGTTQVTYNGHPLYYYAHEDPGEVECHDISTHGGLWWVIQPNGIRAD